MEAHLSQYENSQSFLDAVSETLYRRETINNLILGVSERLLKYPLAYDEPFFGVVQDEEDQILLMAMMTPPHHIILAGGDNFEAGIPALIEYLLDSSWEVPGVVAPVQIAQNFSDTWRQKTGQNCVVKMNQRVYECRNVRMPHIPEGHFRSAHMDDQPVIVEWMQAFEEEALHKSGQDYAGRSERLIQLGYVFVWDKAGGIVSMAMKARPLAHSITIGGVYTPPNQRRKGYATALVAHLAEHLLASGYQFINLFTDLDNPTSNDIYQKIGFHPVIDFQMQNFTPGEDEE